jgi:hypothetical protein
VCVCVCGGGGGCGDGRGRVVSHLELELSQLSPSHAHWQSKLFQCRRPKDEVSELHITLYAV